MTCFGPQHVPATHCLAPDGRQGFRSSPYLQELGCYVGQHCPFDEASELLARMAGIDLSDKQIERICHYHGQLLEDELYTDQVEALDTTVWYVGMDGSMVFTRADEQQPGGWKEIKLARLFKATDWLTSERRSFIRRSDYVAHLGEHTRFEQQVAARIGAKRNLIALGDGARWIWEFWSQHYPQAVQILDIYHVLEKLGGWARLVWGDTVACRDWMLEQQSRLEADEVSEVLEAIRQERCLGECYNQQQALLTYLTNNQARMRYGTYLKAGYLIGSGPVESANREVVQQRLKLSGQRWTPQGLQQVANLRVAYKSGRQQLIRQHFQRAA
jgi:hypothetical protein